MSSDNRPVQEIRIGRVKAAIWENETENGSRHNVTVCRLYKDDEDMWQDSKSFGRDDIPLLIKVLDRAHDFCYEQPPAGSEQPAAKKNRKGAKTRHDDDDIRF